MAELINLNKARKHKVKTDKKAKAVENRRRFGLSKSQNEKNQSDRESLSNKLDGLRIYRPQRGDAPKAGGPKDGE